MAKTIDLIPQEGKQRLAFDMDVDVMIYGGGAGCLPASTEVLTERGWKRIDQCDKESVIAQYDVSENVIKYLPVFDYIKLPCETLYSIQNNNFGMTLSEEHTVLYKHNMDYGFRTLNWREILNRHQLSKNKGWTGKIKTSTATVLNTSGIDYSEGELRLQIAVMADGRIVKEGRNNYTQMRFSKKRKYERLLSLCNNFGLKYKDNGAKYNDLYSNNTEYEVIVFPKTQIKHFNNSFYSCTQEQLNIIADEVCYWDGSFTKSGSLRYFSKYKIDADFIQYAFSSLGLNTSIVFDKREGKNCYTVNASSKGQGFRSFANKDGKRPIEEVTPEDGYKYCFTTITGYFVVRQNNRIFITGNSGKSYLSLLKALKYAYKDPAFNGVIFRRNTTPVREGLFATAKRLYMPLKPRVREQAMEMDFKHTHGGHLKFTHLEQVSDAEKNHQGQEYTMVLFDELCQFEQEQFIYLLGRLRSESSTNAFCMATCNPDPDSFVLKWVEWYLDEDGFPDKDKIGIIRYFILKDDEPIFANDPQDLIDEYPEMCFMENDDGEQVLIPPQSFCFIAASVFDNKELLRKEPRYLSKMKGQTDVMRRRLLEGNWYARAEGANFFSRKWLKKIDELPDDVRIVRAWDKGYTEPSEKNRYPDYTSSIKMAKDMDGNYYIMGDYCNNHHDQKSDVLGSFRKSIGVRNKWMLEQAEADRAMHFEGVNVVIPKESGAGKGETDQLIRMFESNMFTVSVAETTNVKNAKEKRFSAFSSAAENGLVYILENTFNKATLLFFYDQLEKFDGTKSTAYKKDDLVDAVSDAYNNLQQDEITRPVKLPNKRINTLYNNFKFGNKMSNYF